MEQVVRARERVMIESTLLPRGGKNQSVGKPTQKPFLIQDKEPYLYFYMCNTDTILRE